LHEAPVGAGGEAGDEAQAGHAEVGAEAGEHGVVAVGLPEAVGGGVVGEVEHGREVVPVGRAEGDLVRAVAAQEVGGDRELDGGGGPAGVRGVAGAPGRAGDAVGEHDREVAGRADGAVRVGGALVGPLLLRAAPRPVDAARRGGGRGRWRDRVRGGGGRGGGGG